jgi:chemotaxis protein MotB
MIASRKPGAAVLKLSDLRKRLPAEDDLWPISLADMMTLLLCFFLIIVAVSHVDLNRYERVADSMQKAMVPESAAPRKTPEPPKPVAQTAPPPEPPTVRSKVNRTTLVNETPPPPEPAAKPEEKPKPAETKVIAPEERTGPTKKSLEDIRNELASKLGITNGAVEVTPRENGVELNLRGAAFFDLASAEIKTGGLPLLRDIATTLAGTPYKVTVEGHTDNLPMESWLYPSNWELSSARASRVARFLIDHGVPRDRMRVEGLADTQPVAPNTDPTGRSLPENQAKNRRVVILVSP